MLENWSIILVLASIIFSWANFKSDVSSLQAQVNKHDVSLQTLNENYQSTSQTTSNNIASINTKLDIIMKHDGL